MIINWNACPADVKDEGVRNAWIAERLLGLALSVAGMAFAFLTGYLLGARP